MLAPSLMTIVSNWPIARFDKYTGDAYHVPALSTICGDINRALNNYDIVRLSRLTNYVGNIVTESDIQGINSNGEKYTDYHSFTETPLFQRLEQIREKQLPLKGILSHLIAMQVAEEITIAVKCGFAQELRDYKLEGIVAYPDFTMTPIRPILVYYSSVTNHKHEINTIQEMMYVHSPSVEKLILPYLRNYSPDPENCKFADVKHHLLDKASIARKEVEKKIGDPIESLKEYFSCCLAKYESLDSLKICIEYIIAYQNCVGGVNLSSVLSYDSYGFGVTNLFLLYKKYGVDLLHLPGLREYIPSIVKYIDLPQMGSILIYNNSVELFNIIAQNCTIPTLIQMANIVIEGGSGNLIRICSELNSSEFSKIVLIRLQENRKLSKIFDIVKYCLYAFNVDKELALICALQANKIEEFLDACILNSDHDTSHKKCQIGEYVFSPKGADLVTNIQNIVDTATFFEFKYHCGKFAISDEDCDVFLSVDKVTADMVALDMVKVLSNESGYDVCVPF